MGQCSVIGELCRSCLSLEASGTAASENFGHQDKSTKSKFHSPSFPSFLHRKPTEVDPSMQELEALIDRIQKQVKDYPCRDNIREAFQVYDKEATGYVDKEVFFKICSSLNVPVDDSLTKEVSMNSFPR